MKEIVLKCPFGSEFKKVRLLQPFGGSGGWQVYIDNYYQGDIFYTEGWYGSLNVRSELTQDDINAIGEIITEKLRKMGEI